MAKYAPKYFSQELAELIHKAMCEGLTKKQVLKVLREKTAITFGLPSLPGVRFSALTK